MAAISGPDWSKLSSVDPELVRALVTVVDSGGFTAAAKQLHRTQPAISLRIRALEERLETRMFLRLCQLVETKAERRQERASLRKHRTNFG